MRDCLLLFPLIIIIIFFLYLYCHFSLACYLLSPFHHVSDVNLLCKKERKYLRAVFGDARADTSQGPGGGTESSPPVHSNHHLEITVSAKEKPRTQEHLCYVCLLSGVCPKETRTSGTISAPPHLHPAPPTYLATPPLSPTPVVVVASKPVSVPLAHLHVDWLDRVSVAYPVMSQSLLMPHTDPSSSHAQEHRLQTHSSISVDV